MTSVPPLLPLWVVEKDGELRAASLFPHPIGFEVRIVDRAGVFVQTQVHRLEADAMLWATERHDLYVARDWKPLGKPESGPGTSALPQ
jgi:hypothetical protein